MTKYTKYDIRNTKYENAFTLIEILIFTAIVSVFFVIAASVSAFSLRVMRSNENKVYATHYAEESIEWLRNEKETTGWSTFSSRLGNWCLNSLGWTTGGTCALTGAGAYALGSEYSRQFNRDVSLTNSTGDIAASVTVSWKDVGGATVSVPVRTIFAQTE